jgi:hypothetical protein
MFHNKKGRDTGLDFSWLPGQDSNLQSRRGVINSHHGHFAEIGRSITSLFFIKIKSPVDDSTGQ